MDSTDETEPLLGLNRSADLTDGNWYLIGNVSEFCKREKDVYWKQVWFSVVCQNVLGGRIWIVV